MPRGIAHISEKGDARYAVRVPVVDDPELTLLFKALSNPTRLRILGWLKDPHVHFGPQADPFDEVGVCVKQIQEKAGVSQSTASQFMATLQRAGLVTSTRRGHWTYYRRDERRIAELAGRVGSAI
jgi:DNA-binding transcriptional ArsR family regulator